MHACMHNYIHIMHTSCKYAHKIWNAYSSQSNSFLNTLLYLQMRWWRFAGYDWYVAGADEMMKVHVMTWLLQVQMRWWQFRFWLGCCHCRWDEGSDFDWAVAGADEMMTVQVMTGMLQMQTRWWKFRLWLGCCRCRWDDEGSDFWLGGCMCRWDDNGSGFDWAVAGADEMMTVQVLTGLLQVQMRWRGLRFWLGCCCRCQSPGGQGTAPCPRLQRAGSGQWTVQGDTAVRLQGEIFGPLFLPSRFVSLFGEFVCWLAAGGWFHFCLQSHKRLWKSLR